MAKLRYRTLFLSDTHLGLKAARTEYLLDFLKHVECETLYLVGDIFDIWEMKTGWHWRGINMDGVICGHIHHPVIAEFDGITYANCGDWVESCTAPAEQPDGSLQLILCSDESLQLLDKTAYANSNSDGRVASTS